MEMGCSRNELLYIAKSFQIWVFSAGTRFNPSMTCREIIPRMVFSYCGVWSRLIHFVGVGSGQTLYIVYIYIYLSIYLSIYLIIYLSIYITISICQLFDVALSRTIRKRTDSARLWPVPPRPKTKHHPGGSGDFFGGVRFVKSWGSPHPN